MIKVENFFQNLKNEKITYDNFSTKFTRIMEKDGYTKSDVENNFQYETNSFKDTTEFLAGMYVNMYLDMIDDTKFAKTVTIN